MSGHAQDDFARRRPKDYDPDAETVEDVTSEILELLH
jgi:hypothetical protein